MVETATILCVDDEKVPLELRSELLTSAGYQVITAQSSDEAIDLFQNTPSISAVVLDFFMPKVNGRMVAEQLKSIRPRVPIIMLTGARPILDEVIGRVDAWIVKGDSRPEELLSELKKLINR